MTKCDICHDHEAEYAMQYLSDNDVPSFCLLGRSRGGVPTTKICLDCYWDVVERKEQKT